MDRSSPSVAQSAADVSSALTPRMADVSREIYDLIVRDIPELRGDKPMLMLLEASVGENVATVLHSFESHIDLEKVGAPAAAEEYARRLAQRGVPVVALLRAYRIGAARFQDQWLSELGRLTRDASLLSTTGLRLAELTAMYIDRVSEGVVAAYEAEKENWLRNQSAARAGRVRALLRGEQVDVNAAEAILGYRLGQHHVGVVCWSGEPAAGGALARLELATAAIARLAACEARPLFLPQDEFSAWAWLPVGTSRTFAVPPRDGAGPYLVPAAGLRFAFGTAVAGVSGFRRTHQQALGAYGVALAAGSSAQLMTGFGEVAPLALMTGSMDLVRAWVIQTLGSLACDDDQNGPRRASAATYDAWLAILRASQPGFEFTDPPFRHSLPMTLAFAATAAHPTAVLTGPLHRTGTPATPARHQPAADRYDMAPAGIDGHPLTATAVLAWSGDLPRQLQQILFDTADHSTYGKPSAAAS